MKFKILHIRCCCIYPNSTIGTHDIQNITVTSSVTDEIRVTGDFVNWSSATGVFLIFYSFSNQSDVYYILQVLPEGNIKIDMTSTGLTGTRYGVSVFALEDGLPFPRVVTLPKNITVANNNDQGLFM